MLRRECELKCETRRRIVAFGFVSQPVPMLGRVAVHNMDIPHHLGKGLLSRWRVLNDELTNPGPMQRFTGQSIRLHQQPTNRLRAVENED